MNVSSPNSATRIEVFGQLDLPDAARQRSFRKKQGNHSASQQLMPAPHTPNCQNDPTLLSQVSLRVARVLLLRRGLADADAGRIHPSEVVLKELRVRLTQ